MRRALVLLAACLAGAAGMGLETILIPASGLALGYGRSSAWGLAVWVAGWAIGAFLAARSRMRPANALALAGVALALVAFSGAWLLIDVAGSSASETFALALGSACLFAPALLQGMFLPLLLRGGEQRATRLGSAGLAISANLAGALAGAWCLGTLRVAAAGRIEAARECGELALLAGAVGWLAQRALSAASARVDAPRIPRPLALALGVATGWMLIVEWIGLRLGVLWFGGMQETLVAVLCASLAALTLGALLIPPLVPRGTRASSVLALVCLAGSSWYFLAAEALQACAGQALFVRALVLVGPALLGFGAWPAVLHRELEGDAGVQLGRLYLQEAWGAALFLPLAHAWLVPAQGLGGTLIVCAWLGALLAVVQAHGRRLAIGGVALVLAAGFSWIALGHALVRASPPLANPAFVVQRCVDDREFAVSVVDDGILGERTLLTDGFRAAGTGESYRYMRALGHLPVLLHPHPRTVAVLALGTGTTVGAVFEHPEVETIDVLEISRAVVEAAPLFEEHNAGALKPENSARVHVQLGDGRRTLAQNPGRYDVLTMEPLLPDSPFGVYLYTEGFYRLARRALAPGGLVCQWVPPHALEPRTFDALLESFRSSFPWSSAWLFGTQVVLVGGEALPALDASRWPTAGSTLDTSLHTLGLGSPRELARRFVAELAPGARAEPRALTDDDPWIVYLPRRRGLELLGDLPLNLAGWSKLPAELPERWSALLAPAELEGARALRGARIAFARGEAELRGLVLPAAPESADPGASLARARELLADDPELLSLAREIEFVDELRAGVQALGQDPRSALTHLVRAAELQRQRADVHLYLALALEQLGERAAPKALAAAAERCPTIARTREGQRARDLGLSQASWEFLERADAQARTQELR